MPTDAKVVLDEFFESIDRPAPRDLGLGKGTPSTIDHAAFGEAYAIFEKRAAAAVQGIESTASRDRTFRIIAGLSVLFLVVVFALTYTLVQKSVDVTVTLGADAAVLLAYIGLLRYMLKHEEQRWQDERRRAREAALLQLALTLKSDKFSPEQMIQLLRSMRGMVVR